MRAEVVPYCRKKTVYFEKVRTGYKCLARLGREYKKCVNYYYRMPTVWSDLIIKAVEKYGKKIGAHGEFKDHALYEVPDDFLDIVHDIISIKDANYSRLLRFELPETYEEFAKKIREIRDMVGMKLFEKSIRDR